MESVLSGREVLEVSKLQGASNYALWFYKVRTILQGERLWGVVDPDVALASEASQTTVDSGESSNPTTTMTLGVTASAPAAPATTSSWIQRDEDLRYRATRIIVPTMKYSIMPHIMNISDPRRIWIKLRNLNQSSSTNRLLSL
jgi:hypothetical protein